MTAMALWLALLPLAVAQDADPRQLEGTLVLGAATLNAVNNAPANRACSAHPACAARQLAADCCPTRDGVMLACCNQASVPASVGLGPEPGAPLTQRPLPFNPEPSQAPVSCVNYMQQTGCGWTLEYNCPGQAAGSKGAAGNDQSTGYQCCCNQGLYNSVATPVTAIPNNPGLRPEPATSATAAPGARGPEHTGMGSMLNENIPRSVKLKWKLMQWFEDKRQCPLNLGGGFPAWVGYKSVTAASPAISTPPKGVAGNRTITVDGFCPTLQSAAFQCVKEYGEVKARVKPGAAAREVTMVLDGLECSLKDISVYRIEHQLGMRLDFHGCQARDTVVGQTARPIYNGIPETASMNALLEEEILPAGEEGAQFTEFMLAVCNPDLAPTNFLTINLPRFMREGLRPGLLNTVLNNATTVNPKERACWAETANTAHVLGKNGCFRDFLFFDLTDVNNNMAKIPARDIEALAALVPGNQHWRRPHAVPAPVPGTPGPHMIAVAVGPVPTPAPVEPDNPCAPISQTMAPPQPDPNDDPCRPPKPTCATYTCPAPWIPRPNQASYLCLKSSGCCKLDLPRCCMMGTTTTTTVFVPEVPGVVVADRVCIEWRFCNNCNNWCDCSEDVTPQSDTPTTSPWIPVRPVCEDFYLENLIIAAIAVIPTILMVLWVHERCVAPWTKVKERKEGDHSRGTLKGGHMATAMASMGSMRGPGTFNSNACRSLRTEVHESKYAVGWLIFMDFWVAWIVPIVIVHSTYFIWSGIISFWHSTFGPISFQVYRDLNGIDWFICPWTFFPLIVALWFMSWLCMIYWFAFVEYKYMEEVVESPVVIEVNASQAAGAGAWWRAGGLSPLSWFWP